MSISDNIKREFIRNLGTIIEHHIDENGNLPNSINRIVVTGLNDIEECNESWCDGCEVRNALGGLCCDRLNLDIS